jgi:hypothetical protein
MLPAEGDKRRHSSPPPSPKRRVERNRACGLRAMMYGVWSVVVERCRANEADIAAAISWLHLMYRGAVSCWQHPPLDMMRRNGASPCFIDITPTVPQQHQIGVDDYPELAATLQLAAGRCRHSCPVAG